MAAAWVYVLRCADGSLYTGWTVDLERRLAPTARDREPLHAQPPAGRARGELAAAGPQRRAREEARIKALPRAAKLSLLAEAR